MLKYNVLALLLTLLLSIFRPGLADGKTGPQATEEEAEKQEKTFSTADSLTEYELEELVVTAKRAIIPVESTPLSVSLLSKFEIETSLANSSTGVAGELPGVFIQRTGDFGRHDINIRGLGSRGRKSLVLIDGKPETMALFGCTVTHSFLMHDVQRIEVVRGPSSMMYGSGAMGGVVNIIPKRSSPGLELEMRSAAGSDGTLIDSGRLGGGIGPFFGSASVDYRESDGHIENSAYSGTDIIVRGGAYTGGSSELILSGKLFKGFKEEPTPASVPATGGYENWNDYRRGSVDLHFKDEGESLWYSARYYRNFGEHRFSDGFHSRDATDGLMAHIAGKPLGWLEISGGADWRYQQGELPGTPGPSWDKWDAGAYSALEVVPVRALKFSTGARYNRDKVSGSEISPSFGINAEPAEGTVIRLVASHGFRSPQINELYMYPSSNEKLEAERVWNYEAGIRRDLPLGISADLAAFVMKGKNLIETVPSASPPPMYTFENTGEFEFTGVEFSLSGRWVCGLSARFSASILDPGNKTAGRPGRKLDLSLSWISDRSTIRLRGREVGEYFAGDDYSEPIESYAIVDIYADLEIMRGLRAYAGIDNILDEDYLIFTDLPGGSSGLFEMRGRSFIAGLRFGIN